MASTTRQRLSLDESTPLLPAADIASNSASPESPQSVTTTSTSSLDSNSNACTEHEYEDRSKHDDEEAQLLQSSSRESYSSHTVVQVMMVLLIGMFISNADSTVVVATHPIIASEFNDLEDSSWLSISFSLAAAATQSLYAKLSDIFGRRTVLVISYALFAIGCAIVGAGQTMWQVILGRVISGSGGAGLSLVAAVAIADLVPLREVGSWNSYINLASTAGRSLGGPLGGFLADTIGWRWLFLGQSPFFLAALFLCLWVMPNTKSAAPARINTHDSDPESESTKDLLARIDFLGALLLGLAILGFMIPLEVAGQKVPWSHPLVSVTFALAVLFLGLFVLVEHRYATDPVFPLKLLRNRDVVATYVVTFGQVPAQVAMMFTVPMYFQISQRTSATRAGAHLFPAVAGNALASILTGLWIKKTGLYKPPITTAAILAAISYTLLYTRWTGDTNWWEAMYIVPGGAGSGMAQTAVLIALQASVSPEDKAAASAGMFLIWPIGIMAGLAVSAAVMLGTVKVRLEKRLAEIGIDAVERVEIIRKATASLSYVYKARGAIGTAVTQSYIDGIGNGHLVSLAFVLIALIGGVFIRQRKL